MLCKTISTPRFGRLSGSRFVRTGAAGSAAPPGQDPSPLLAPRPGLQSSSAGTARGASRCGRDARVPGPALAASRPDRTPAPCRNPRRASAAPLLAISHRRGRSPPNHRDGPSAGRAHARPARPPASLHRSPRTTGAGGPPAAVEGGVERRTRKTDSNTITAGRVSRPCPEPYITTASKEQESESESSLHATRPVGFFAKRLEHERRR